MTKGEMTRRFWQLGIRFISLFLIVSLSFHTVAYAISYEVIKGELFDQVEDDLEIQGVLSQLNQNPDKVLQQIENKSESMEELTLLSAIFEMKGKETLREELASFFDEREIVEFDLLTDSIFDEISKEKGSEMTDTELHILAGAAASFAAAALAYDRISSFDPNVRSVLLASISIMSAILAGGAKEGLDSLGFGTVEWRDFGNTVLGGAYATLFVLVTSHILDSVQERPEAVIGILGVGAVILALPVGVVFYRTTRQFIDKKFRTTSEQL